MGDAMEAMRQANDALLPGPARGNENPLGSGLTETILDLRGMLEEAMSVLVSIRLRDTGPDDSDAPPLLMDGERERIDALLARAQRFGR